MTTFADLLNVKKVVIGQVGSLLTKVSTLLRTSSHDATNFRRVPKNLRQATISFVTSVCLSIRRSARNNSADTGRIFMKFDIRVGFENLSTQFKFRSNMKKIMGTSHEDQ